MIFTLNVSTSINLVASGLTIPTPGEILLTDHEYGAMHWCWERAAIRQGLTLKTFPLPTGYVAGGDRRSRRRRDDAATRLFFFSHVLSPTGLVLPAKELCRSQADAASSLLWIGPMRRRCCRSMWMMLAPTFTRAIATSGCWRRRAPASWGRARQRRPLAAIARQLGLP